MNPFLILVPLIVLACPTLVWAAPPDLSGAAMAYAPYAALILAFVSLGVTIGVLVSRRRRLSTFAAVAGGLFLGPLAVLLLLAPARNSADEGAAACPGCGGRLAMGEEVCGHCGWSPEREARAAQPAPAKRERAEPEAKRRVGRTQEAPPDLSSEFAQYSEMLRKTLPGALDRGELIDYSQKFAGIAEEDDAARCSNPSCRRLLPSPYDRCPHCGTEQDGYADVARQRAV